MDHLEELNPKTGSLEARCSGCGAPLQHRDPALTGYIPEKMAGKAGVVCMRCYRIKHYNELTSVASRQDEFLNILSGIGQTRSVVLHIVDIFDFEGSLMTALPRFVGSNPLVVALNKVDLLHGVNPNRLMNWARRRLKEVGLKAVDVLPVSARTNSGIERLAERMESLRNGRDIYVVGATNTGKSTLINRLIADYSDLDTELTTSRFPGTTLDMVRIPLDDGCDLVDTPGIVYPERLSEQVTSKDLATILPEQPIRPRVYQLHPGQTIFFGALARFDFIQGERQSFACYVSNALHLHRTKQERADSFYERHKGELLQPPAASDLSKLPPLVRQSLSIPKGDAMDVFVSGLGWIRINSGSGAQLDLHVPKGTKVALRESLV